VERTVTSIRALLDAHARLAVPVASLGDGDDLYEAGLTSMATVSVMLAIEESFNVEFPEAMLGRRTFASVSAIAAALSTLRPPD
jgi:acyl carrier protein